jgi:pyruvate,water dikinase
MATVEGAISSPKRARRDRTVPVPTDFPVVWENEDDARRFWSPDLMHYPDPTGPAEFFFMEHIYSGGFNRAAEILSIPVRLYSRRINTYYYQTFLPVGAPPEAVLKMMNGIGKVAPGLVNVIQSKAIDAAARKYIEAINPYIARLLDLWNGEWLPEIKSHLAFWDGFDLRGASNEALLRHLDDTIERTGRIGEIHFLVGFPLLIAMSMYEEVYTDIFGESRKLEAYRLLQGFENKTIESGRELWKLSRRALAIPEVRAILESEASADVIPALKHTEAGRAFLLDMDAYTAEYGQRADKFATIGAPSWIEDPTPVIKNLKDFITQIDRDLDAEMDTLATERERLIAQTRTQLKSYPKAAIDRFEFHLKGAQAATILQEDHGFWIDFRCLYRVRKILLEMGRRLTAARLIDAADDFAYLTLDEMRNALASAHPRDLHATAAERRAEMERFGRVRPPSGVGTPPLAQMPDDPLGRTVNRFFGAPAKVSSDPMLLNGHAGSSGNVRGIARVVRKLSDAAKLRNGEILVAETTAAPWTPLFATAAAVVTDTGGVLSHCAVVAREYRIPAVVGTGRATATIKDGQLIEVNGDAGTVRILSKS